MRFSIVLLLLVAFLNYMGIVSILPLFNALLFEAETSLLRPEVSLSARGVWMGVLLGAAPLFHFLMSPIFGSLSDQRGRRPIILFGIAISVCAYLLGALGVFQKNIWTFLSYRLLLGISLATLTVIQAALVDMSTSETKARLFSLFNMALGIGFAIGPFIGGGLSGGNLVPWFNLTTPFLLGAFASALSLSLVFWKFDETRRLKEKQPTEFLKGLWRARIIIKHPRVCLPFLAFFLFLFGWDYFIEFASIPLKHYFDFSTTKIGNFYAYAGVLYALFTGCLIPFLTKRFSALALLLFAMVVGGSSLLFFLSLRNPIAFWGYIPILELCAALYYPIASIYISNQASDEKQGEVLGVYQSVQGMALILSPIITGGFVGKNPSLPIYLGGGMMLLGGVVLVMGGIRARKLADSVDKI